MPRDEYTAMSAAMSRPRAAPNLYCIGFLLKVPFGREMKESWRPDGRETILIHLKETEAELQPSSGVGPG
jgi:hypothetical protein